MLCFVDESARSARKYELTLKSPQVWVYPPLSSHLSYDSLAIASASTVRPHCDMRMPSDSIYPFACGYCSAQCMSHCDGACGEDTVNSTAWR
jgi:hypothetical protein